VTARYVIDTNILVQAYIREPHTARVQTVLQGLDQPEPDELHIPEFTLVECANVLWQHICRHGMPIDTTKESVRALLELRLHVHLAANLLPRAFEIGVDHALATYDSIHIALAEKLNCPLITLDERQSQAAVAIGVTLKSMTDFPEFVEPEE